MVVTPTWAKEVLETKNKLNRNPSAQQVKKYAELMRRGDWRETHQGIAFGTDGTLFDGQHRLAAVVEAGVPITMMVTYDLDDRSREAIDTGRKRTPGDLLKLFDLENHGKHKSFASMARVIYQLEHGDLECLPVEFADIKAFVDRFRVHLEWASKLPPRVRYMTATLRGVLAYLYCIDNDKCNEFARQISTGVGIEAGSAVHSLQRWLEQHPIKDHASRMRTVAAVMRSFLLFLEGKSSKFVRSLSGEDSQDQKKSFTELVNKVKKLRAKALAR
jgi:hypothetical protein